MRIDFRLRPRSHCSLGWLPKTSALAGYAARPIRVADRVHTFTGALTDPAHDGWTPPPLPDNVVLQTHCHEYATFKGHRPADLLRRLGVHRVDEAEGCCGPAGNFGFETQHYDTSVAVADLALTPRLHRLDGRPVIADGFSCATQIDHLTGDQDTHALHLAELLDPNPEAQSTAHLLDRSQLP
ncbi:hypothetical protein ACFYN9_35950 [Streptomyces collinus]|uniref:hypothetical protein n=1 Tax=Streptomyces collinus TaxID=42684 RepID=UPI0036A374C7